MAFGVSHVVGHTECNLARNVALSGWIGRQIKHRRMVLLAARRYETDLERLA